MPIFRPFKAFRPKPEFASHVAAKPYDVLNSDEAREEVKGNPMSFLHVGKPEIDLEPSINVYSPHVYQKGKENLQKLIDNGILVEEKNPCFYLYAQTMNGKTQYGLVGCASVEDYWNGNIKKHENTRPEKEEDRCEHVRITNAHTGPIFLAMRDNPELSAIIDSIKNTQYDNHHIAEDGISHTSWVISKSETIEKIMSIMNDTDYFYVADGHHRTAAAGIVGREKKQANKNHTGEEEYNFFLSVIFQAGELTILDYNRVVKDLNGLNDSEFLEKIKENFEITEEKQRFKPLNKYELSLYLDKKWYKLEAKKKLYQNANPVDNLAVSVLQKHILTKILGIDDPRTSKRIDFIGGIRGLEELERRVDSGDMSAAFALFPTSMEELISISDSGEIMPPKSTWFEPKLRDGLFIHFLD